MKTFYIITGLTGLTGSSVNPIGDRKRYPTEKEAIDSARSLIEDRR